MRKHETRNSVAGGPATRHARPRDGRRGVWAVLCRRQVYSIPAFGAKKVVKYPLPLSPLSQRGVTVLGDTGGSGGVSDLLSLRPSLRGIPSRQTIIGYRIASHKHRLSNVETVLGRSSLRASARPVTPSSTRPVRSKEAGVDVLSLDWLESLEQLLVRLPRQDRPLLAERVPHLNQGEIMHVLQRGVCCAGMRQDACVVLALLTSAYAFPCCSHLLGRVFVRVAEQAEVLLRLCEGVEKSLRSKRVLGWRVLADAAQREQRRTEHSHDRALYVSQSPLNTLAA